MTAHAGRYATLGIPVGQRAFVRLSTRSAKDCILKCPSIDFKQAMLDRLKKVAAAIVAIRLSRPAHALVVHAASRSE
jgi:hypothetical protein